MNTGNTMALAFIGIAISANALVGYMGQHHLAQSAERIEALATRAMDQLEQKTEGSLIASILEEFPEGEVRVDCGIEDDYGAMGGACSFSIAQPDGTRAKFRTSLECGREEDRLKCRFANERR